jgi:exodeoxyribonuclease-3
VKAWLETNQPDLLLLQELKGTEFPAAWFKEQGYESASVTQKTYHGVAVLSRSPIETVTSQRQIELLLA